MTKKDFVLQMLDILKPKRDLAADFVKMINMGAMTNDAINALTELLKHMALFVKDERVQQRLRVAAEYLERLKTKELEEQAMEKAEADSLLANL